MASFRLRLAGVAVFGLLSLRCAGGDSPPSNGTPPSDSGSDASDAGATDSCAGDACASPTCTDGTKNGKETDVDCGGPTCPKCSGGKSCVGDSDCAGGKCTNAHCARALGFGAAKNFPDSVNPTAIATGDFDGNGKLDLAVSNDWSTAGASVLLGNGDGTFGAPLTLSTGVRAWGVAAGDFNGDKRTDLAIAITGDNGGSGLDVQGYLVVLVSTGGGTFAKAVQYPAGFTSYDIATADLDGDKILDVAIANWGTHNVTVHLGVGDGTFKPAVAYPADIASSMFIGDVDGNAKLDLLVANWTSDSVSVFLGNGDGTMQAHKDSPCGHFALDVALGAFTHAKISELHDAPEDAVVADGKSNAISLLVSNGDGTFKTPDDYPVGTNPARMARGDLNLDDNLDVAVATDSGVSVLLGQGTNVVGKAFAPVANFPAGTRSRAVAIGDFDADGLPDLAVANYGVSDGSPGSVSILLNTSK